MVKNDEFNFFKVKILLNPIQTYYFWLGLSNMCTIAHVKTTNSNFFLKKQQLFSKTLFNIKCISSNTKFLF
jgi:hypothetical protein